MLYFHTIAVGFENKDLASLAFMRVVGKVCLDQEIAESQDVDAFMTSVEIHIGDQVFSRMFRPKIMRYGDDRFIFYHQNGSRIELQGSEITVEFTAWTPSIQDPILAIFQEVSAYGERSADTISAPA